MSPSVDVEESDGDSGARHDAVDAMLWMLRSMLDGFCVLSSSCGDSGSRATPAAAAGCGGLACSARGADFDRELRSFFDANASLPAASWRRRSSSSCRRLAAAAALRAAVVAVCRTGRRIEEADALLLLSRCADDDDCDVAAAPAPALAETDLDVMAPVEWYVPSLQSPSPSPRWWLWSLVSRAAAWRGGEEDDGLGGCILSLCSAASSSSAALFCAVPDPTALSVSLTKDASRRRPGSGLCEAAATCAPACAPPPPSPLLLSLSSELSPSGRSRCPGDRTPASGN